MNNRLFVLLIMIISVFSLVGVYAVETTTHNFDGLFNMSVPASEELVQENLGIDGMMLYNYKFEDGDPIGDNIVVYYFNQSLTGDNSTNLTEIVINNFDENTTFKHPSSEDGFTILHNQMIQHDGGYLVLASDDNNTEIVGVVGDNLDDLKNYAKSIVF